MCTDKVLFNEIHVDLTAANAQWFNRLMNESEQKPPTWTIFFWFKLQDGPRFQTHFGVTAQSASAAVDCGLERMAAWSQVGNWSRYEIVGIRKNSEKDV